MFCQWATWCAVLGHYAVQNVGDAIWLLAIVKCLFAQHGADMQALWIDDLHVLWYNC